MEPESSSIECLEPLVFLKVRLGSLKSGSKYPSGEYVRFVYEELVWTRYLLFGCLEPEGWDSFKPLLEESFSEALSGSFK